METGLESQIVAEKMTGSEITKIAVNKIVPKELFGKTSSVIPDSGIKNMIGIAKAAGIFILAYGGTKWLLHFRKQFLNRHKA